MDTRKKTYSGDSDDSEEHEIVLVFELAKIYQGYLEGTRTKDELLDAIRKRRETAHEASWRLEKREFEPEMEEA